MTINNTCNLALETKAFFAAVIAGTVRQIYIITRTNANAERRRNNRIAEIQKYVRFGGEDSVAVVSTIQHWRVVIAYHIYYAIRNFPQLRMQIHQRRHLFLRFCV